MERSSLEDWTINQLQKAKELYEATSSDEAKMFQINNAISILSALKGFYTAKIETRISLAAETKTKCVSEKVTQTDSSKTEEKTTTETTKSH